MKQFFLLLFASLIVPGLPVKAQPGVTAAAAGPSSGEPVGNPSVQLLSLRLSEGLSSTRITSIVQDKQGNMWFGSEEGLNRYNGQTIKVFRHVKGNNASLSGNSISRMLVDRKGNLWVGTPGSGLSCYDPRTGTFTAYRHEADRPASLPSNAVQFLLESRAGEIWIGADDDKGGLIRFTPGRKQPFTQYLPPADTNSEDIVKNTRRVRSLLEDKDGTLWVGTRDGLYHFDPDREVFDAVYRDKPTSKARYFENLINTIYQDENGTLWLGYWGGGLKRFRKDAQQGHQFQTHRYVPVSEPNGEHNLVISMLDKSPSELWVSTHDNGLAVFNKNTGRFTFIKADPANPAIQYPLKTSFLYRDRSGIVWVGSFDEEGVRYINPYAKAFQAIPLPAPEATGPGHATAPDNTVASFYPQGENLYVGLLDTKNLYAYNTRTGRWKQDPVSERPLNIRGMLRYDAGTYWLSTNKGILAFDTARQRARPVFPPEGSAFEATQFTMLLPDRKGNIWIGSQSSGLFKYSRRTGSFVNYYPVRNDPASLAGDAVWDILEDGKGSVWVATNAGVSRYDPRTNSFTRFMHDPKRANSLPAQTATSLLEDANGSIWVGTLGGGLCNLQPGQEDLPRIATYTVKDGLPSDRVFDMVKDQRGRIWLGTARGLACFSPGSKQFRSFDKRDGLVQNQLDNGLVLTPSGHILAGFNGRFTRFHPDSVLGRKPTPPLTFYSFEILDKEAALDSTIAFKKNIVLAHGKNFFTVRFALLNYVNPERNRYRYKLEGYDRYWNATGNLGYAPYTNVPPGQYTLRVKAAATSAGGESENTLSILILPPWWRTWWAYALYGALGVVALLLGRREVVRRERVKADLRVKQAEYEKWRELDALKSRFFANISHEFRTPLTLILGTVDDLQKRERKGTEYKQQYGLIQRNARRLLQLINQLLDLSKLEAGKLGVRAEAGNLTDFLKVLFQSFSSQATRQGIAYRLHLPEGDHWALFDADKLEKIFTNLLSNAFKFTPEGGTVAVSALVDVPAEGRSCQLTVSVSDTGIGIPAAILPRIFDRFYQRDNSSTRAFEGTGIGLALTKELTELLGGHIAVESREGEGAVFTVVLTLPLAEAGGQPGTRVPPTEEPLALPSGEAGEAPQGATSKEGPAGAEGQTVGESQTKVLVVEDNADLRRFIGKHLPKEYLIIEAENGAVGWTKAFELLPDLVITDVMMPEVDGLKLCRKLKQHAATFHIPVILLTARVGGSDKMVGLEMGADDYLVKPFDARELAVRVKNLIEERRRLQQYFRHQLLLQPSEAKIPSADEVFIKRVMDAVEAHLADPAFDVERLAREVGLSRSHLSRKLSALTGQAASDFIRTLRLRRAASLLSQRAGNVAEVAYQVGFKEASYFSSSFTKEFGQPPSEYAAAHRPLS